MATVIRNPIILHCLQRFGLTPEEVRAVESGKSPLPQDIDIEYENMLLHLAQQSPQDTTIAESAQ